MNQKMNCKKVLLLFFTTPKCVLSFLFAVVSSIVCPYIIRYLQWSLSVTADHPYHLIAIKGIDSFLMMLFAFSFYTLGSKLTDYFPVGSKVIRFICVAVFVICILNVLPALTLIMEPVSK